MKQTIDSYRLTSMEEPTDEVLSQLMKEAAEEAKRTSAAANARYFEQLKVEIRNVCAAWK